MPDDGKVYHIECPCFALSGRFSSKPGKAHGYLTVEREDAIRAILGLVEQGFDIMWVLDALAEKLN